MLDMRSYGDSVIAALYDELLAKSERKLNVPADQVLDASEDTPVGHDLEPREWIEQHLWIVDKQRRTVRLLFNDIQTAYWGARTDRDLILKYRKGGITTIVAAEFFEDTVRHPNTISAMVAHDRDTAERIFRIVHFFFERLPESERRRLCSNPDKPQYRNRQELYFDKINSWFYIGTAGNFSFGRGATITNFHGSEVAHWPNAEELINGAVEAVPDGGRIRLESTAKGVGNWFHAECMHAMDGNSDFAFHFFPWFIQEEYRLPGPPLQRTEEEEALAAAHGLDDDQLRWRRARLRRLRDSFAQEYPSTPGEAFRTSMECFFDREALDALEHGTRPPERTEKSGKVLIWADPVPDREYVIGADAAEGLPGADFCAAYVLDKETGEDVAAIHGWFDPHEYGRILGEIGRRYNDALLAVERENHGHSVLNTLMNHVDYPNLYYHRPMGRKKRDTKPGWTTNAVTRPIMLDDLRDAIESGMPVNDAAFLYECRTFVRRASGKYEAAEGMHDDRVIARAIAWQIRRERGRRRVLRKATVV